MLKDRVVVDSIPTWGRVANKRFKPLSAAEIVAASYAGLELFIEDAPHNARRLAEGGLPVLLFDQPYNHSFQRPGVFRCRGWSEVLQ